MRHLTACVWLAALSLCAAAWGAPGAVRVVAKGQHSGVHKAAERVVHSVEDWKKLWAEHTATTQPTPPLPAVDFQGEMVVAVFLGDRPTGGYGVEITQASAGPKAVVVSVRRMEPAPGSIRAQMVTQPFAIVAVPRSELPVKFVEERGAGGARR